MTRAFSEAAAAATSRSSRAAAAAAAATSTAAGARPEVSTTTLRWVVGRLWEGKAGSMSFSAVDMEEDSGTAAAAAEEIQARRISPAMGAAGVGSGAIRRTATTAVFQLEKSFKTTFSLLVLHMWLILRRLKEEGKDGVKFGQYIYEIYNHDVELRVSKAGVNLLLTKWMKELEKIFYGNIVKYDAAISPEARHDDLVNVIWRNVYTEEGTEAIDAAATPAIQALARYTRREATCLSLTDKEAMFSGNFKFTTLLPNVPSPAKPVR
ncbi:hypothetical protein ABZP36_000837 [Zizania latifolia]